MYMKNDISLAILLTNVLLHVENADVVKFCGMYDSQNLDEIELTAFVQKWPQK